MASDTQEKILSACAVVIARAGLPGFRMTDVAREAGVSIGLLSYHFGDRDGLLQAALDHVNAGTAARAAHSTPSGNDQARARLETLLCSDFGEDTGIRAGSIAWNELRAAAVFAPTQAAALARSTGDWQSSVAALVRAATELSDQEAEQSALHLTALVEGLSGRWLTGQITVDAAQATVRSAVASLLG